jgi:hypothetical protein
VNQTERSAPSREPTLNLSAHLFRLRNRCKVYHRLSDTVLNVINSRQRSIYNGTLRAEQLTLVLKRDLLSGPINDERHISVARPQREIKFLSPFGQGSAALAAGSRVKKHAVVQTILYPKRSEQRGSKHS